MVSDNLSTERPVLEDQWLRISNFTSENEKARFRFLYIGSHIATKENLSRQFRSGYMCYDFDEAKDVLLKDLATLKKCRYDVIFIDVPFDKKELYRFSSFLKKNRCPGIVLIYNANRLTHDCIRSIRSGDMVDDIFDIQSSEIDYEIAIRFLQRSKRAHKLRHLRTLKNRAGWVTTRKCISFLLKRTLDIIVAATILLLLLPIILIIAVIIKLESRGPVFYTSLRAGKGYKVFKFHKFRTMIPDADKEIDKLAHLNQYNGDNDGQPIFYKIQNDPRVTRFGKFLRNSSLDEIPQLINVLKGDMSLVGNRPLPLYEAATLTTNECVERFTATAGITGLWQVKKRGRAEMSVEERINLDITYARNENMAYDLWIMLCTPVALIQKSDV